MIASGSQKALKKLQDAYAEYFIARANKDESYSKLIETNFSKKWGKIYNESQAIYKEKLETLEIRKDQLDQWVSAEVWEKINRDEI